MQLLCFWTLSIDLFLFKAYIEPTHLGPVDRAGPCLWTQLQHMIGYVNQAQRKPFARVKINIKKTPHV